MARKLTISLVALAVLMTARSSHAQYEFAEFSRQYVPFGPAAVPDWQWFAPVAEADVMGPPNQGDGYFFSYERLNWWTAKPNRNSIGANAQQTAYYNQSVNYFYFAIVDDDGIVVADTLSSRSVLVGPGQTFDSIFFYDGVDVPLGNIIDNSIDVAIPKTHSGSGNRWEFGWMDGHWGWMASILDGVDMGDTYFYGFDDKRLDQLAAAQGTDGIDGFNSNQIVVIDGQPTVIAPIAPTPGEQAVLAVDGLLTVQVLFEDPFDLLVGFIDGNGGGIADDINNDLNLDENDMLRLAPTFDDVRVRHAANLQGVELISIRRKKPTYRGMGAEVYLGVRYLELKDTMDFLGRGGILADTSILTRANNRIIGPQFGFRLTKPKGRWNFTVQGRALFGANFLNIRQDGVIADHLTPGPAGVPFALAPSDFSNSLNDEKFSPVGELRAEAAMLLTRAIKLKVGWNGLVIGGATRATNATRWRLPNMGIINSDEEVFIQGVNAGFEINR